MKRARDIAAQAAYATGYAIGMALVIAWTIATLPIAAWQRRKARR